MAMDLKAQLTMSGGVIALAVALMPVQAQAQNPWMDEAVVAEQAAAQDDAAKEAIANKRAKMLLSAMTLEQKLQQLTGARPEVLPELPQCYGARHVTGIASLNIPTFRITNGPVGLGQNDCVSLDVMKEPTVDFGFGPVQIGVLTHPSSAKATALPSATTAAASFDPAMAALYGEVIATEMHNLGLHVFEAPGVNLARLPILGRNFEYFGEDPYLSGVMAVAETKAIQSRGLIAMPKHYAANEQETNRMTIQTTVDRQTLRELYLLPFEMAVKDGKAAAGMWAYNYVKGQSACESREVLTDILRKDWGFTGYVQSDFFAMKSTVATMANGMDHEMPFPTHWAADRMKAALSRGELNVVHIDTALERRYTQAIKAGVFDRKLAHTPIDFAAGGQKAREIGGRGAVLLQNNGALPMRNDLKSLVLIGKASQVYAQQAVAGGAVVGEPMGAGGGSSDVVPNYTVTPIDGLRAALSKDAAVRLILVDDDNANATIDGKPASFADAVAEAAKADAVVMMAGTISEEGADRATFTDASGKHLAAPASLGSSLDWYAGRSNNIATSEGKNAVKNSRTTAMIDALMAARSTSGRSMAAKSVLVLKDNAGVSLPASLLGKKGPAILESWFPGQEDGNIVADVLFGKVNPSGKLPVTFPVAGKAFLDSIKTDQFPGTISADGKQQTVTYSERLAIGYRWYDSNVSGNCSEKTGRNPCVAFPFGHGLSYTSFAVGKPKLAFDAPNDRWVASARVSNTGKRPGAEVVQVYLQLPESANSIGAKQPPRRLIGFKRIELAAGASGDVEIAIDPKASNHPLSVWDEVSNHWVMPQGTYTVWIGRSSSPKDLVRTGSFTR
ncbi:MAG TPA: glycoside hydrolase family 3 C-terminal domain-containing protein [Sphingorhabdus sp.]|nr:glycoside hydrolase family 3 C-terminal domain-containing protein [Sphingorhabdus sp.]